jgi:RNA polymerase sigma-70 factor (ECF subfamily)
MGEFLAGRDEPFGGCEACRIEMVSRDRGFGEFFAAHYASVVRGLTLATGNASLAEDAAQEAFARAVRKWSRVRAMERPVGWVWVVAMNDARRHARRAAREEQEMTVAATPVADAGASVTTRVALREAIAALPSRQREAVVLRYFADLSLADTASAMQCAVGTVKSAVHAALATLRIELDDEDDEDDDED